MPGNAAPARKEKMSLKQRDRQNLKTAKLQLKQTIEAALEYQKAVGNMVKAAQTRIDQLGNILHDVKDVLDEVRPSFLNDSENAILVDAALVSIGEVLQPKKPEPEPVIAGNQMPVVVDAILSVDGKEVVL